MKTYTIKKGHHYSTSWLGMAWRYLTGWQRSPIAQYRVRFTESCLGATHDPNDADDEGKDIHKLFGLSEGLKHHENSARFGWKEMNGGIALFAYVYSNGVRLEFKLIYIIDTEGWYNLAICRNPIGFNGWGFYIESSNGQHIRAKFIEVDTPAPKFYQKLYPYIGGDYTAKNNVYIHFDEID